MAGLALGSYSAGKLADRIANPLAWFGATELLIGVSAVVTPWLIVMQWIPGTEAEYKLIAHTFLSVFPETTA